MDNRTQVLFVASLRALLAGQVDSKSLGICYNLEHFFHKVTPEYTFDAGQYVYVVLYKAFDYLKVDKHYPIVPPKGYDGDAESYFYEDNLWEGRQLLERQKLLRKLIKVFTSEEHSRVVHKLPSPTYL